MFACWGGSTKFPSWFAGNRATTQEDIRDLGAGGRQDGTLFPKSRYSAVSESNAASSLSAFRVVRCVGGEAVALAAFSV